MENWKQYLAEKLREPEGVDLLRSYLSEPKSIEDSVFLTEIHNISALCVNARLHEIDNTSENDHDDAGFVLKMMADKNDLLALEFGEYIDAILAQMIAQLYYKKKGIKKLERLIMSIIDDYILKENMEFFKQYDQYHFKSEALFEFEILHLSELFKTILEKSETELQCRYYLSNYFTIKDAAQANEIGRQMFAKKNLI